MEQLFFKGLLPDRHCQNLAVTVVYVPYSLDSNEEDVGGAMAPIAFTPRKGVPRS